MSTTNTISERRGKALSVIALPIRISPALLEKHADAVFHPNISDHTQLRANLEELGLGEYLQDLVKGGFDSWESILTITEEDLSRMKFNLGHRRKLQRKIIDAKSPEETVPTFAAQKRKDDKDHERRHSTFSKDFATVDVVELGYSTSSSGEMDFGNKGQSGSSTYDSDLGFVPEEFMIIPDTTLSSFSNFDFQFPDSEFEPCSLGYLLTPDPSTVNSEDLFANLIEAHAYTPATPSNQMSGDHGLLVAITKEPQKLLKLVPGTATCIFVLPRLGSNDQSRGTLYRAMYLRDRTVTSFLPCLAQKCGIDVSRIVEVKWINRDGHHIAFDDDAVCNLKEGQSMVAEFEEVELPPMWRTPVSNDESDVETGFWEGEVGEKRPVSEEGSTKSKYYKVALLY